MSYQAPLTDIKRALASCDFDSLLQDWPGDTDGELAHAILEEAGRFAEEVLAPLNRIGDEQGCVCDDSVVRCAKGWPAAYQQFSESGWGSLAGPLEYGGQALPMTLAAAVQELWESANMSFALCPLLTRGAVEALCAHGDAELKARFLPNMISGRWTGTMNLTEPQAGSDLAAVRTRAVPEEGHYRIRGQKVFITYGEHDLTENIIHLVLARTPDAPPGVKGISLFVVPKFLLNEDGTLGARNDLRAVSVEHKLGIHGSPTCVMSFGDTQGAIGYLVGEENRGLMYMFTMMNAARHAVGVQGYALSERAYQQARDYASERVQGRGVLAQTADQRGIDMHPDVRRILLHSKATIQAMRGLALHGAMAFDRAELGGAQASAWQARGELLTPLIKAWSTEEAVMLTSQALQIHGGMGFIEETGAAQYFRDVRITPIYEGTTGIQANDFLGRKYLRDGGQALQAWYGEIERTIERLTQYNGLGTADVCAALTAALADARASAQWMQERGADVAGLSAAVPFMLLHGILGGAWALALQVISAATQDAQEASERLILMQVFCSEQLTRCHGLMQSMRGIGRAVSDYPISAL